MAIKKLNQSGLSYAVQPCNMFIRGRDKKFVAEDVFHPLFFFSLAILSSNQHSGFYLKGSNDRLKVFPEFFLHDYIVLTRSFKYFRGQAPFTPEKLHHCI